MPITDRLLLGPGPSNPYPEAVAALGRPMLGHMDPEFLAIMDETMARLRTVFRTDNALTFPVSGTGSAGMEACFVNLLEPGDTAIIGVNGVFGDRMCEVARRCGAEVVRVEEEWGLPLDPQRLLDAQREHPDARLVAVVHAETSTGVENDIAPLAALRDTDTLLVVDTVTSLGGIPVEIDAWGVDASYSGTQKCLGVPPGLSPVTFSPGRSTASRPARSRRSRGTSTCRSSRTTSAAPPACTTTPRRSRWCSRCTPRSARSSTRASKRRGPATARSGPGSSVRCPSSGSASSSPTATGSPSSPPRGCPEGADDAALRKALLDTYGIEVGGGLGELRRARRGASGSWVTRRASARSRRCSARCASCSGPRG